MSDTNAPPPEDQPGAPRALPAPAADPPRHRPRDPVPLLYAAGFAALALAILWLWARPLPEPAPAVDPARLAALEGKLGQVETALTQLGTQLGARLAPIDRRLAALEARPTPPPPAPAPDLAPIGRRLAALEAQPAPSATDLGPVESRLAAALDRIAALEARPVAPALPLDELASRKDLASLAARQDTIAGRQDALAARQQQAENELGTRLAAVERKLDDRISAAERSLGERAAATERTLTGRIAALETRIAAAEQVASRLPQVEDRAARLARLAAAQAALESGRPLGALPGAPAELARFATAAPPTEAALRLAFPAAARAAREAAGPDTSGQGVLESAWNRAQALVTVRRGEEVVVGDPAAGVLATARRALDAGDLAGAVTALDRLPPAAAAAMADWTGQARALLAARAALARLAA